MRALVSETVLTYQRAELEAWKKGDWSVIPAFVDVPDIIRHQPTYHFGEMLVLRHYHDTGGWQGFASYALGPQYPGSERRRAGRAKVDELIPRDRLARLRRLRCSASERRFGVGEPDLFLFDDHGRFKFVEVKKATDRLRPSQLRCMAQIIRVLCCEVDIVYVREAHQHYSPKTYILDLRRYAGWAQSPNNTLHRPGARVARPGR